MDRLRKGYAHYRAAHGPADVQQVAHKPRAVLFHKLRRLQMRPVQHRGRFVDQPGQESRC